MAVAQALYSPFVILLSMLVLGERFLPMQWGGLALVLGGILLVSYSRSDASVHGSGLRAGIAWAVLSVFAMAIGIVMAKPMLERHSFLWVVSLRVFAGFAGLALAALLRGELRRIWTAYRQVRHWGWIVAGALVGTYLSMMLWLAGYKYTQASIAAVLNELAAVFILPLAVLILREPVQARQWIGVGLALAGVTLVVI